MEAEVEEPVWGHACCHNLILSQSPKEFTHCSVANAPAEGMWPALQRVQGLPGTSLGSAGMFTQGRHPLAAGTHSHPGQWGHHGQQCQLTKQMLIPALATPCVGGVIPVHRSQAFYLHRHLSKPSGNHRKLERPKRLSQIQSDVALYEGPVSDTWPVSYTCKSDLPHHSVPGLRDRFCHVAAAAAKLLQLCLTLCDPIDGSPPGSSVHGIF